MWLTVKKTTTALHPRVIVVAAIHFQLFKIQVADL